MLNRRCRIQPGFNDAGSVSVPSDGAAARPQRPGDGGDDSVGSDDDDSSSEPYCMTEAGIPCVWPFVAKADPDYEHTTVMMETLSANRFDSTLRMVQLLMMLRLRLKNN